MFITIDNWHNYNWNNTSVKARAMKLILITVQVLLMYFIYIELFKYNPDPNYLQHDWRNLRGIKHGYSYFYFM